MFLGKLSNGELSQQRRSTGRHRAELAIGEATGSAKQMLPQTEFWMHSWASDIRVIFWQ
jgi:hypothetical protein